MALISWQTCKEESPESFGISIAVSTAYWPEQALYCVWLTTLHNEIHAVILNDFDTDHLSNPRIEVSYNHAMSYTDELVPVLLHWTF